MDRDLCNPWDTESFSRQYAMLQEQQAAYQAENADFPPGSPAHGSGQLSEAIQGLNDLRLNRGSKVRQEAGPVRRTFFAIGKEREQALNETDKDFIDAFEQTALATTDAAPRTIRNHALGLTRLSNALTADNRPGIADRINDPELDDLASKLDTGKPNRLSVRGLQFARNWHSGRVKGNKAREQALNKTDKEFIGAFEQTALATTDAAPRTIRNHAIGLTRLSNALTADNRPGIADRINDPELDDLALKLDAGKEHKHSVLGLRSARNTHSGRDIGVHKRTVIKPYDQDRDLIESLADRAPVYNHTERTVESYSYGLGAFSTWLRQNKLPAMNGRLGPDQIDALDADIDRALAEPEKIGEETVKLARRGIRALLNMGLGQVAPERHPGSSWSFHTPNEPWPEWQEALGAFANEQHAQPDSSHSSFFRGLSPWEGYNRPQESGSTFAGLSSLGYGMPYGSREFDPNTPQSVIGPAGEAPCPQESGSTFAGLSSLGYGIPYGSREFDPNTPQSVVGPSHPAGPEIVDVDSYTRQAASVRVAQRLADDPWLWDHDLVTYTNVLAQQLLGQPGAQWLNFVDPQQVRLLTDGTPQQQSEVLTHIAGPDSPPILFLPVNVGNRHWSLLVVNRHTAQSFHYDSAISPDDAPFVTNTAQFQRAAQVAAVLGAGAPAGMPIPQQADGYSCGDHVLGGIEALAHRVISGEYFQPDGMDLRNIRPDRQRILAVLTQAEQFGAAIAQPQPPRERRTRRTKKS